MITNKSPYIICSR